MTARTGMIAQDSVAVSMETCVRGEICAMGFGGRETIFLDRSYGIDRMGRTGERMYKAFVMADMEEDIKPRPRAKSCPEPLPL